MFMKKLLVLVVVLVSIALAPICVRAQEGAVAAAAPPDLSSLPEADVVLYLNPPKILNEAMPRFLPAKQNDGLREALEGLKKVMSVDLLQMKQIVLAMRMRKPVGNAPMPLPEYLFYIKGGVNAATLTGLQVLGGQDVRNEKYGTHDVFTITIKDIAKQSEKMPFIGAYSELAVTALHEDTYVAGTTSYVRAAIDADEGRGRMNAELVRSITRDPESLISINASMLTGAARAIALIDPARPGKWDCLNELGQTYASARLSPGGLRITGALNADNPETAGIIKNLIVFLIEQAKLFAPDPEMKSILSVVNLSVEGNEIVGSGEVPQATIQKMLESKPSPPAKATATASEPAAVTAAPVSTQPKPKTRRSSKRRP
jgi:hypothetical protein